MRTLPRTSAIGRGPQTPGLRRTAGGVASVALGVALLAGCAAGAPSGTSSPALELPAPTASKPVDPGTLPTGTALSDWAETVLPENRAGGTAPVARSTGELAPTSGALIDLTQGAGQWEVSLVCQSIDGVSVMPTLQGGSAGAHPPLEPLACGSPADPNAGHSVTISYDGGAPASLQLTATQPAVFVYEIRAGGTGQD